VAVRVAIDQGANLKALRRLQDDGLVELRQANELEQTWSAYVAQQTKAIMLGHWRLGADVLADDKVHEVARILGPGKRLDAAHVHAAYLNGCEYFVTEDVTDFFRGGRRENLEALLGVKIRRTEELVQELAHK
jgi:hypothetical protein